MASPSRWLAGRGCSAQLFEEALCVECGHATRTGAGDGDDEALKISLDKVPSEVQKIAFTVTIHDAEARKQNFGMVSGAFIRLVNNDNDIEVARYDLTEDASTETAMVFGEFYRNGTEWKFKAVGQGFAGGLSALAAQHGVSV